jgi:pyruvate kinase
MSKIETTQAVENIEAIARESDALMVARGDLWAELDNPWSLPRVTCKIISAANAIGKKIFSRAQFLR